MAIIKKAQRKDQLQKKIERKEQLGSVRKTRQETGNGNPVAPLRWQTGGGHRKKPACLRGAKIVDWL